MLQNSVEVLQNAVKCFKMDFLLACTSVHQKRTPKQRFLFHYPSSFFFVGASPFEKSVADFVMTIGPFNASTYNGRIVFKDLFFATPPIASCTLNIVQVL